MASDSDDSELEDLQRQLVTLQQQNQELEKKRKKDHKKAELLQQIEAEKQKTANLSSSQPQTYTPSEFVVAREDLKEKTEKAVVVGLQSLHDKTTGQNAPNAPSTWVPVREELKKSLFGFITTAKKK